MGADGPPTGRASGSGPPPRAVDLPRGRALLNQPLLNKGTAFTPAERAALGLEGLLPSRVGTLDEQVERAYGTIARKNDDLEKYIGLLAIQDRNEHLFYRLLIEHIDEFLPIVYTPTVGEACRQYSRIYRRPRGMWITPEHRGRIAEVLARAHPTRARLLVVTDNERILGLGDMGAGGIGIPVGKSTLYTAAAGIHPSDTLAVSLDVGTDNEELLDDPLYMGWRRPRLRGEPYFDFVEEFVEAVRTVFPDALLQWEDFKKRTAFTLLDRYRDRIFSFNDDIQGTAAVTAAGVISAGRITGRELSEQRVLIVGAGAAGIGIARQLRDLFRADGLEGAELIRSVAVLDSGGLLHDGRELGERTKEEMAWPLEVARDAGLAEEPDRPLERIVEALEPTVLVGASGQAGLFTEPVIRAMLEGVRRPAVLPLSNPTSKSEARPDDLIRWSGGRALVATGSPFPPVEWEGRTVRAGQANNLYVFPGVGLGCLVAGASRVSNAVFRAAADALASEVSDDDRARGMLFPPISEIRRVTRSVATAVATAAREEGDGERPRDGDVEAAVTEAMWWPDYPTFVAG